MNAHSEKVWKFDLSPFMRLAGISERRDKRRAVIVRRPPLPSEGKGQKFESSRARHDFNDLAAERFWLCVAAEAPRKQAADDIRAECRVFVGGHPSTIVAETRHAAVRSDQITP